VAKSTRRTACLKKKERGASRAPLEERGRGGKSRYQIKKGPAFLFQKILNRRGDGKMGNS